MQRIYTICCFFTLLLAGCSSVNENDKSKRNENWAWFEDSDTGEKSWIPLKNESTVKNGNYKLFYFNGNLFETGRIAKGKHIDTTFLCDKSGKEYGYKIAGEEAKGIYFHKNGHCKTFYSNGNINHEGLINNNRIGDKWTTYYRNGRVSEQINLQKGIGFVNRFYENGNPRSKLYRDLSAKEDKTLSEWYESGEISFSGNIKDGEYHGLQQRFFENGRLKKEWEMSEGVENGFSKEYLNNTTLIESQNFVDGQISGKAKKWYPSGKLKAIANFEDGKANGIQKFYYENGQPQAIMNMKFGVPDGENLQFDTTGKLIKTLLFENGKRIN